VFLSNTTGSNSFSEHSSNIWHSLNPLILCVPSVAQPLNLVLLIFSDSTLLTPSSQTRPSKPAQEYCSSSWGLQHYNLISLDKFRKPILEKWLSYMIQVRSHSGKHLRSQRQLTGISARIVVPRARNLSEAINGDLETGNIIWVSWTIRSTTLNLKNYEIAALENVLESCNPCSLMGSGMETSGNSGTSNEWICWTMD